MRLERLTLMVLFAVLPAGLAGGSTTFDIPKFLLASLMVAIILGTRAWNIARGHACPLPSGHLIIAAAMVILALCLSLAGATAGHLVWRSVWVTSTWIFFGLVTATATQTTTIVSRLLAAALLGVAATCLYGLAQIAGWLPGGDPTTGFPPGISTLGNQNFLAGLAAVALWPSLALWRGRWKFFGVGATLVAGTTVVAAGATGPLIAVLAAGVFLAGGLVMVHHGHTSRVPQTLGLMVALAVLCAGWFVTDAMMHTPEKKTGRLALQQRLLMENSGHQRRTDWLVAAAMFKASPLTGVGVGNYKVRWPEFRARLETEAPDNRLAVHTRLAARAHNEYLQLAAEGGLVSLALFMGVAALALVSWRRRWHGLTDPEHATGFLMLSAGLLTVAFHGLVSFPLHLPATGLFVVLLVGLLASPVFARAGAAAGDRTLPRPINPVLIVLGLCVAIIALREFRADLLVASGRRQFVLGQMEPAVRDLRRAVESAWWSGQGTVYLGLAEAAQGQAPAARRHLAASLNDTPTYEAMLALAELHVEAQEYSQADALLQIVQDCRPFDTFIFQARYLEGLALLRQEKTAAARGAFRQLLQDDPDNYRAHLALGYLAALAGDQPEARQQYRQALAVTERRLKELPRSSALVIAGERVRLQTHRRVAQRAIASLGPS